MFAGTVIQVISGVGAPVPSVFTVLALLTRVGSAGLAVAIAVRTDLRDEMRSLAFGLVAVSGATMLGGMAITAPADHSILPGVQLALANGLFVVGGFGWARFLVTFPVPLRPADLHRAAMAPVDIGLPGLRAVKLGKVTGLEALVGALQRDRSWRWAWLTAGGITTVLSLAAFAPATRSTAISAGGTALIWIVSCLLGGTTLAAILPALTLHRCDREDRRRLLWLLAGIVAALYAFFLGGVLLMAYVVSVGVDHEIPILFAAAISLSPLPFLLFLIALIGAALVGGALDPGLALRRAMIVSSLGAFGLFLFAVVESALSDTLLAGLGAPPGLGSWVAAGTAAVALRPLQRWIDSLLSRHFPEDPGTGTEGAP